LRMVDEEGNHILPGAFLPAAERYNLITQVDRWVIENAFALLAANQAFLKQVEFISINLSGQTLAEQEMLDFIIEKLQAHDIKAEQVCFEITETAAIANLSMANRFISSLRERGCKFALDDFGSGLSSFGYLKNLKVDCVKIDGMFVKDMVNDPMDRAIVKSVNEIGQMMGIDTIAEFVENDDIKNMLKKMGINFAQGYGITRPLPLQELLDKKN
ncbi:MAG: EAL domain-containing protein (putative c-di-GMP-specific phosphodiesterase class I), partial [Planctomycetota bacterium]